MKRKLSRVTLIIVVINLRERKNATNVEKMSVRMNNR